jgi:hypothetical protein
LTTDDELESMVAFFVPKWTAVAPERWLPWTVTLVPPLVDPLAGESDVTAGLAASGSPVAASAGGASALAKAEAPPKDNPAATRPWIRVRLLICPFTKLRASSSSGIGIPLRCSG